MLEFGEPVPTAEVTRSRKRKAEPVVEESPCLPFGIDEVGMSIGKWFDHLVARGRMEPMGVGFYGSMRSGIKHLITQNPRALGSVLYN